MLTPNSIDEAYQRLAALQREYEAAHARTVALERALLVAQNEVSRLEPAEAGRKGLKPPVILGPCYGCRRTVTFSKTKWVGKCRRCGGTLHPRRHGELTAGSWELNVSLYPDEDNRWYWTVEYPTPDNEHPPMGNIFLRLQGELGESLQVEGYSLPIMEKDRHETYRIIHWTGNVYQDVKAAQAWATRAFVKSRPY